MVDDMTEGSPQLCFVVSVERVGNGWIVYTPDGTEVFSDHEHAPEDFPDRHSFVDAMHLVADEFGVVGGRYDSERFRARLEPGDKHAVELGGNDGES